MTQCGRRPTNSFDDDPGSPCEQMADATAKAEKDRREGETIWAQELQYRAEWMGVPAHHAGCMVNYIVYRLQPGSFFTACFSNDLMNAIAYGDNKSLTHLATIMRFIINHAPARCWGSKEAVEAWLRGRGEARAG